MPTQPEWWLLWGRLYYTRVGRRHQFMLRLRERRIMFGFAHG